MARLSLLWPGIIAATLALGCRDATQITVDLTTNVPCDALVGATVTVSDVNTKPDTSSPELNTSHGGKCKAATPNNEIGTVVLVPSGDNDAPFKLYAIAGLNGQDPTKCFIGGADDHNCIIARRKLAFVAHTELVLPIVLWEACRGNFCAEDQTCVVDKNGDPKCVGALIEDPGKCKTPDGCGDPTLPPVDGGGGGGGAGGASSSSSGTGGAGGGPAMACAQLALGAEHTCTLAFGSQSVRCWGRNDYSQLGDPMPQYAADGSVLVLSGASYLGSKRYHSCAVVGSEVKCWGLNDYDQSGDLSTNTQSVAPPKTIATLAGKSPPIEAQTGSRFSCARLMDGSIWCWGDQSTGQLNGTIGLPSLDAVQVMPLILNAPLFVVGSRHSCVGDFFGLWCWGDNAYGELGTSDPLATTNSIQMSGIVQVALSSYDVVQGVDEGAQSCALLDDATVQCWGDNKYGQLGDGTQTSRSTPMPVSNLTDVAEIAMGRRHVCARKHTGDIVCWGDNKYGQLGIGSMDTKLSPWPVVLPPGVVKIAAGGWHTCALYADGSLKCWGDNTFGQLGRPYDPASPTTAPVDSIPNACK